MCLVFLSKKTFCLVKTVDFSYIQHLKVILLYTNDTRTVADREIEIDDAETVGEAAHQWEQTGRE